MRHIESDIIKYLDRHIRINEYEFKKPFSFVFIDSDMFGDPFPVRCLAEGITGKVLYGSNREWSFTDLDSVVLTKILAILELGNYNTIGIKR